MQHLNDESHPCPISVKFFTKICFYAAFFNIFSSVFFLRNQCREHDCCMQHHKQTAQRIILSKFAGMMLGTTHNAYLFIIYAMQNVSILFNWEQHQNSYSINHFGCAEFYKISGPNSFPWKNFFEMSDLWPGQNSPPRCFHISTFKPDIPNQWNSLGAWQQLKNERIRHSAVCSSFGIRLILH